MTDSLSIIRMNTIIPTEKLRTLLLKVQMIILIGQLFLMMIVDALTVTNQIQVLVSEFHRVFMTIMKVIPSVTGDLQ